MSSDIIQKSDIIVLVDNRNKKKIVTVSGTNKTKWRKQEIKVLDLIGKKYNSCFQLTNGMLDETEDHFHYEDPESEGEEGFNRNNKELNDDGLAQKLSMKDIEEMKLKNPELVIDELVKNSSTFQSKNQYTKMKYKKKKEAKYIFKFRVLKPTLYEVAQTLFEDEPGEINYLSPEALSLTLHFSTKFFIGNTAVIDRCKGLLLYGLLKRLPNQSKIFNLVEMSNQSYFIFDIFKTKLLDSPISNVSFTIIDEIPQIHNLVICGEHDPLFYLKLIYKKCVVGTPITIQCKFLEPLVEITDYLSQQEPKCIRVMIHDIFSRNIQVLKNRTHPNVEMNAFNGYILTAIKSE